MNIRKLKLLLHYVSYCIRRPHRKGHGIHSPFLFDFVGQVLGNRVGDRDHLKKIRQFRKNLLKTDECVQVEDFGAGSSVIAGNQRKLSQIVRISSSSAKYGRLLYHMAMHYKPEVIVELGSCLGLGTMYLASGNPCSRVYTIEGSAVLQRKASENYAQLGFTNIVSKLGKFDVVLPEILNETGKFDLAFVDGNHIKEATIRYFNQLLPYARSGSAIIFDDIRWSEDMENAWFEICRNENVKLSLDLFNLGIVFFNPKLIKQHFELFY